MQMCMYLFSYTVIMLFTISMCYLFMYTVIMLFIISMFTRRLAASITSITSMSI